MVAEQKADKWVVKRKFTFAAVTLAVGTVFASKGIIISNEPEELVVVLSAFGTFAGWILALVFAADVADKKLNNGSYYRE